MTAIFSMFLRFEAHRKRLQDPASCFGTIVGGKKYEVFLVQMALQLNSLFRLEFRQPPNARNKSREILPEYTEGGSADHGATG